MNTRQVEVKPQQRATCLHYAPIREDLISQLMDQKLQHLASHNGFELLDRLEPSRNATDNNAAVTQHHRTCLRMDVATAATKRKRVLNGEIAHLILHHFDAATMRENHVCEQHEEWECKGRNQDQAPRYKFQLRDAECDRHRGETKLTQHKGGAHEHGANHEVLLCICTQSFAVQESGQLEQAPQPGHEGARACVCVCGKPVCQGLKIFNLQGGHSMSLGLCPTKLPVTWEARADHPCVPAKKLDAFADCK